MKRQALSAFLCVLVLTVLLGVAYPLIVTGLADLLFPRQASGSLILRNGRAVGSTLIGQPFSEARYFWGRPSATSPFPYNAALSGGSNLGPTNPELAARVEARIRALREADPAQSAPVPVDLVTASASGLDPDISPAAALYQVPRVARARNLSEAQVRALVEKHVTGRALGLFGEPTVNVLELNLALDTLSERGSQSSGARIMAPSTGESRGKAPIP
ncbi:MAG: potassium-transporting ATPase subunit KdpC [Acidobacteriota bacterium]